MEITQKMALYNAVLTTLRSEISKIHEETFIYKLVVDTVAKIPYFNWIGIYFFNPVTKEFYLGYHMGKSTNTTIIQLNQLETSKIEIINDLNAEQEISIGPEVASECKMLLMKNKKILGLIVIGSEGINNFDEIDSKYLMEITEIVSERIYHH